VADTVVLVVPTIQDGPVVRWYRDLLAARNGNAIATGGFLGAELVPVAAAEPAPAEAKPFRITLADRFGGAPR
jgi:hypothetical protein